MPDIIDTEYELDRLFGADGLIHQAPRQNLTVRCGKRQSKLRSEDPHVCLTCTAETCDGSADCYRRRKKQLSIQRRKENETEDAEENPA